MSYYQIWFAGLEALLKERALVNDDEIVVGHALHPPKPVERILSPGDVAQVLYRGGPTERETNTKARFKAGDTVRAKNINPLTHTRLPRYVRGHLGQIERVIGCHVFPDSNATGAGENPQWLYTVRFDGRELWGEGADPSVTVSVDAWEPYLEPLEVPPLLAARRQSFAPHKGFAFCGTAAGIRSFIGWDRADQSLPNPEG